MVRAERAQDNPVGWTPLMLAARDGQADTLVSVLRTPGIDVNETTDVGDNAFNVACRMGHLAVAKLLVAAGSRVEAQAGDTHGPLDSASFHGHLEVVKYLVEEAGADVTRAIRGGGQTPIMCAAVEGHADIVEFLLSRPGVDIDAMSSHGETALTMACRMGHLAVVKVLVAAGSRVEAQASNEIGPLVAAASGGHLNVVKYLVEEAGADVNRAAPGEWTPIRCAAKQGHAGIVEYLLGRPDIDIDAMSTRGERALTITCRMGHLEVVKLLVAAGARVEAQTSKEPWPLGAAASEGHLEVVKYLVEEAGADVTRADSDGQTSITYAAVDGHAGIVEYLLGRPGIDFDGMATLGQRALTLASGNGHLAVVKLLVAAGARGEAQAGEPIGPLVTAALGGHLDVIKCLVEEAGANDRCAGLTASTALMVASSEGHLGIVEYLLGRRVSDINAISDARYACGETALTMACRMGQLAAVKLLVAAGARVEAQAGEKRGPLGAAASEGHLEVVKYLVGEAGADVTRAGRGGETPLRSAVSGSHTGIVEYLLGRPDIDIDARCTWGGERVLSLACRGGNLTVVKLLVAAGASVEAQAGEKRGPLGTAASEGHLEVVKYLVEEAGAEVIRAGRGGESPIKCAAKQGHVDVVEYLRRVASRREHEAEERAAAAAAALLEEEDRAAAKGGSTKKRKKKGKKMGGAAVQTQPSTQPPRDHGLRGTLEPSETPGEAQALAAVLASTTIDGEGSGEAKEGGSMVAGAGPEEPTGQHVGSADIPRPPVDCKMASSEGEEDSADAGLEQALLEGLSCPISFQLMTDPVVADDGHTYERPVIQQWIDKCTADGRLVTSPLTGAAMGTGLKPNLLARSMLRNLVRTNT